MGRAAGPCPVAAGLGASLESLFRLPETLAAVGADATVPVVEVEGAGLTASWGLAADAPVP
jgi:hypothetical protein